MRQRQAEQRQTERHHPRLGLIETTLQDLRYSVRVLASNRVFTGLSVLCLSLAIGTNTTVFTFVNGLLLRPLPLTAPDQLVTIEEARVDDPRNPGPASYLNFLDWREQASDVAEMAAARGAVLRVSDGGEAEQYRGALVSRNLFTVFGVQPARGRGFLDEEDRPAGAPVVLLSHVLWQQRYNRDPAIIGRTITVNGAPRTVIGVMPAELSHVALPAVLQSARLWMPIAPQEYNAPRDQRGLAVYARLKNGLTAEMAGARLGAVARTLEGVYPVENKNWTATVRPLRVGFSATTQAMILMMMGAVTFVLLIACANVANLTLARATGRRHEIATRLALGAPRSRIVRQVLTESLLIAITSVPLGIVIAYWGRDLLLSGVSSPELAESIPIDTRVLLFTIGLAMVTSLLSGFLPAMHAVRHFQHNALKSDGRRDATSGPPHTRLSYALIIGEIALSLILLVGASLFLQSFRNLLRADGGFDTSPILTLRVGMAEEGEDLPASAERHVNELVDRLAVLPGVDAIAAANLMPLRDGGARTAIVPDTLQGRDGDAPSVLLGGVTARFFGVLNVPLLQGRTFTDIEGRSRTPVAIVNKTMARRLWPNENAIGHRFRREADAEEVWFTIIGVSDDILTWDVSDRPLSTAYVPYAYLPVRDPGFFVRSASDPTLLARPARAAIQAFDATLPILDVRTMTEVHYLSLSRQQTMASLFSVLGIIALVMAATGVYGVLSYFVSQRTYEIGIRATLGADRQALVRLFVRQGMSVALVGIVLGLGGAWALARVVRGRLHDVSATDPIRFAAVALVLIAVAFLATYFPARRAAAVDPLISIRH